MNITLRTHCLFVAASAAIVIWGSNAIAQDAKPAPAIDPAVMEILDRTGDYLEDVKTFSLTAEVWQDVLGPTGTKIQLAKTVRLDLRRPDRLHLAISTTAPTRSFWYDGKTFTLMDHRNNHYGVVKVDDEIDDALEDLNEKYGITLPIDDLLRSRIFGGAGQKCVAAQMQGPAIVLGRVCQHVSLQGENIDWQVWIEEGAKPLPRKVVITYKLEAGSPQYTMMFNDWEIGTALGDFVFKFAPPLGATQIKVEKAPAELQPVIQK